MSNEIFANSIRASRDLAGVFEYDGDTGYFYLYEPKGAKIIGALHVVSGVINFAFDNVPYGGIIPRRKLAYSLRM